MPYPRSLLLRYCRDLVQFLWLDGSLLQLLPVLACFATSALFWLSLMMVESTSGFEPVEDALPRCWHPLLFLTWGCIHFLCHLFIKSSWWNGYRRFSSALFWTSICSAAALSLNYCTGAYFPRTFAVACGARISCLDFGSPGFADIPKDFVSWRPVPSSSSGFEF